MLACVRKHLTSNGRFAFDVVNPVFPDLTNEFSPLKLIDQFDDPDGKGHVRIEVSHAYDEMSRFARTKVFYSIGEDKHVRIEEIVLKCFDPRDLETALAESGFEILVRNGSYDGKPFSPASKEFVVVCRP